MAQSEHLTTFEIGSIYGVSPQSLRFYEDEGLLAPLIDNGNRHYSSHDRVKLELIIKGKRLGFSFVELKLLILHTVQQRAFHDVPALIAPAVSQSSARDEIVEEIWQAEKEIEKLQNRLGELRKMLLLDGVERLP